MSAVRSEGVSAIWGFLKYSIYGKSSWYIALCPLFRVSAKRGSTVLDKQ